jgi:hypothetical protein
MRVRRRILLDLPLFVCVSASHRILLRARVKVTEHIRQILMMTCHHLQHARQLEGGEARPPRRSSRVEPQAWLECTSRCALLDASHVAVHAMVTTQCQPSQAVEQASNSRLRCTGTAETNPLVRRSCAIVLGRRLPHGWTRNELCTWESTTTTSSVRNTSRGLWKRLHGQLTGQFSSSCQSSIHQFPCGAFKTCSTCGHAKLPALACRCMVHSMLGLLASARQRDLLPCSFLMASTALIPKMRS